MKEYKKKRDGNITGSECLILTESEEKKKSYVREQGIDIRSIKKTKKQKKTFSRVAFPLAAEAS